MSATDTIRAMLDERGVEWKPSVFDPQRETFYSVENGVGFIVTEFPEIGRMSLACDMRITPEQAIEATLGRGECHDIGYRMDSTRFKCSQCGWDGWVRHAKDGRDYKPLWCPLCGAKVVAE